MRAGIMSKRRAKHAAFESRLAGAEDRLGPTELRVARFLRDNREVALVSSALALASELGTSDATVIRTVQTLGYSGLADFRRELAEELRDELSLASRLARTLDDAARREESVLDLTLREHQRALDLLRRDIGPRPFAAVVDRIVAAPRVFVFGMGPSSALAHYFAMKLARFAIDARSLTDAGLLLADGLHALRPSDFLIMLAYGRLYPEIAALLAHAEALRLATVLITDTLAAACKGRVGSILRVERGRAGALSLHTATLGLIEALLVGVAAKRPTETVASLKTLHALRSAIVKGER
jgi:DNA-binding MurR/RpiR family transcriptional regulator